jgi:TldD protein
MKALANLLLGHLPSRGLQYADVRVVHRLEETLAVRNGAPEAIQARESYGYGVRVLRNGCWGYAASSEVTTDCVRQTVERALMTADAAAMTTRMPDAFQPPPPVKAKYATPFRRDPFSVPLAGRVDLLCLCTRIMLQEKTVRQAEGHMNCIRETKLFANTLGSRIEQEIIECGAGIAAYAIGSGGMQVRSYPNSFGGNYATAGYEFIEEMHLQENAPRIASEAAELLRAPECPAVETDLILDGSQLALQIHESIGHAVELDRILGFEASFAGTSFVVPDMIGSLKYGSPLVNVVADSTAPLGLGTFAYDDEGVAAQSAPIIREGTLCGVLSSCSTAPLIGSESNGAMRADGWQHFPIVRMTNVNLKPGNRDLDELIADTKRGFFLTTNRSWSIDDKRVNFQFATEAAREIKNGKLGRLYRNAVYTGATTRFWNSCDAVCGPAHWRMWGVPNCGKGEPMQTARVGHGCAPARFRNVSVRSAG